MIIMEPLVIPPTESTLSVNFDPQSATLHMQGESYPENAGNFFAPVLAWLQSYFAGLGYGDTVRVKLDIVYFNSSSSKALMNCFDLFNEAAGRGINVSILWCHHQENEIARECGEEFGEEMDRASFAMCPYGDEQ
jgi:hypothetical protein